MIGGCYILTTDNKSLPNILSGFRLPVTTCPDIFLFDNIFKIIHYNLIKCRLVIVFKLFLFLLHFMEVNDLLIEQLAHLSRLTFKAEEKEGTKVDLQKMISFIEKLNEIDTTNVEPLMFMTDEVNVFRSDEVKGSITSSEGLLNAPLKDSRFFKVPKVIRK